MGIIVLVVAILPMLGVGGMQLYKAETPGPVKDEKLTPRITQTAQGAVVRLLPDHARLHRQPAARRHELVRRGLPRVCDAGARRLLDLRRQRRALRFAGDRSRADRVHADLGDEFRPSFHRLAAEEPAHLRDRRRSQGRCSVIIGISTSASRCIIWLHGVYPSFLDGAAPHRVQPGLDRDGLRLRQPGLRRVADVRADGDPDAVLLLREHGLDRRRHQDVPHAGAVPAGAARTVPARPSGRRSRR